jgi:hypothetical protein
MRLKFTLIFLMNILLINIICAQAIISEVELNPAGTDSGNEWIELYSNDLINLTGWEIVNQKGKEIKLNNSFSGYSIIYAPYNFLVNENCSLKLIDSNGNVADNTDILKDIQNNDKSWSYCDSWVFGQSSKGKENYCEKETEKTEEKKNQTKNQQEDTINENDNTNNENNVIIVRQAKENNETNNTCDKNVISSETSTNSNEVIRLGFSENLETEDIKTNKNIVYESTNEKIKKYAVYVFALLCVFFIVLLFIKNGRK